MPLVDENVVMPEVIGPPANLPDSDGIPLESTWHVAAIALLLDLIHCHWQGRQDYFVGGNTFLYYQWKPKLLFCGPDVFIVKGVPFNQIRPYWAVWDEDGKYPNVIIELMSPTTKKEDRTTKKDLYEQVFHTPEYFWYDPETKELAGWRLSEGTYDPIVSDQRDRMWSEELQLWLGRWEGTYLEVPGTYPRFYGAQGALVLLEKERQRQRAEQERQRAEQERQRAEQERQRAEQERQRAEQERQRAEQERQRAEAAEAEVARLKAILAATGVIPPSSP